MLKPDNVFLTVKPVDMRRGIDTLTQYVQDALKSSWHDSAAFIFANKARTRIKVLRWDKHGVWLYGRWRWAAATGSSQAPWQPEKGLRKSWVSWKRQK